MSTVPTLARYLSCHSLSRHYAITIMASWLERSTLSLDSICDLRPRDFGASSCVKARQSSNRLSLLVRHSGIRLHPRSEEHTSELQSQSNLVCRLLLEK